MLARKVRRYSRGAVLRNFDTDTVLITGGGGFLGSSLVRYLLSETNLTIVNLENLTYVASARTLWNYEDHPYQVNLLRSALRAAVNAACIKVAILAHCSPTHSAAPLRL